MSNPQVSIVMSVYNGQPFLEETVKSILSQTFTDYEFVIIDDSSVDDTWEVLTRYADHDQRLVLRRNERNMGVVLSLNRGLDLAKGKFIVRQDADDISLPQRIEKQVNYLEAHPECGLVGTDLQFVDINGVPLDHNSHVVFQNEK